MPSTTGSKTRAVQLRYLPAILPLGEDFDPAIAMDQAIAISAIASGRSQSSGGD
ncbi:hypothetical protein [Laspinema olomoucense]|uniref:Uncharacterized protein n=1 Tax=Laspinema olomoucense D3b TaxID=2953688 RepID=A0ABT2NDU0_9CYAN|nr:hypothetical protein [Laspinema sp. D3b]MCT7980869.1 hypothetical protein [Laspinema sp. D3b]